MNEQDYRKIDRLSYSAVKDFDSDRIKFYKKYILKEQATETPSTAILLGSLVDCELFSKNEFDSRFHIANCIHPSGQMGEFVDELCDLTAQSLDSDLKLTRDLTDIMKDAFDNVKFDRKRQEVKFKGKDFTWLLKEFAGSAAEAYYKECRSQYGKFVVDLNLITARDKVVEELKTCEWTKDIVNAVSQNITGEFGNTGPYIEVLDQLAILFEVKGEGFKAMPDRVIINHALKTITPYDLKISYSGEDFQYNYWKMKYYLQVASYYLALHSYKTKDRPELSEYTIPGIEFIVGSSTLNSNPLLYSTNEVNINEGLYGFVTKSGMKYKGLYDLITEVNWHKKNQLWRNSKEVYDNKGKMVIKPFEEAKEAE